MKSLLISLSLVSAFVASTGFAAGAKIDAYTISVGPDMVLDLDVTTHKVQLWEKTGATNQQWYRLNNSSSGITSFMNVATGECLGVPSTFDSALNDGNALTAFNCTSARGDTRQEFRVEQILKYGAPKSITVDGLVIHPSFSNALCLDVVDGVLENGASLQQWTCHGGSNQRFELNYVKD